MNLIIPFTKEIKFENSIAEITSISLEHEWTYNENELLGNFVISGEYKAHEVSINKEPFEYVLPFSVALTNKVVEDSISFEIKDFTYDIKDNNILVVQIEYIVDAEDDEETREDQEIAELLDNVTNDIDDQVETQEIEENSVVNDKLESNDETYVTYHIHIVSNNETIDSICTKYKTNENVLKEYNDISTISIGDKLIIPDIDE